MVSALPNRKLEREVMSELAIFATHMTVSIDGGRLQR